MEGESFFGRGDGDDAVFSFLGPSACLHVTLNPWLPVNLAFLVCVGILCFASGCLSVMFFLYGDIWGYDVYRERNKRIQSSEYECLTATFGLGFGVILLLTNYRKRAHAKCPQISMFVSRLYLFGTVGNTL